MVDGYVSVGAVGDTPISMIFEYVRPSIVLFSQNVWLFAEIVVGVP